LIKKFIENRRAAAKGGGGQAAVTAKAPAAVATPAPAAKSSTQSWMPVKDVYNGFIHRRDGAIIAAIRVQPVNFELLSDNEKLRKIKSLEEVMNGMDYSFQIISIARPVDLDAFISKMDDMKSQKTNHGSDRIKSRLLAGYMTHAAAMATSGEAVERQFYILLDQTVGKKPQQDEALLFRNADLVSHVCNNDELRDLLFVFTNPNQAGYERAPVTQISLPSLFLPPIVNTELDPDDNNEREEEENEYE
jgi:hypothetical protein